MNEVKVVTVIGGYIVTYLSMGEYETQVFRTRGQLFKFLKAYILPGSDVSVVDGV